jgi:hypothetical protein
MELGNPYVIDRPLVEGDTFVGRHELLAGLSQGLRNEQGLTLVYGAARLGKTSFLRQLASELSREFLCVTVDFSWPRSADARLQADQAWRELQSQVADAIRDVHSESANDSRTLVLVDGLKLTDLFGSAGADFLVKWQGWTSSLPNTQFVVAVDGTLQGAAVFSPALASIPAIQLECFALADTEELLIRTGRGRIHYEFAAIRRIWQLTAGHPYLAQLFGYTLLAARVEQVRVPDVDGAVSSVLSAAQPVMERTWASCSRQAQAVLVLSNELKGRHGVLRLSELRDEARVRAVALSEQEIAAGLNEWLAVGVLRTFSAESYALCCELLARWLAVNKPCARTLFELKFRSRVEAPRTSRPPKRYLHWRTLALELAGLGLVAMMITLWSMRGAAQQLTMGASPTETPLPFATRPSVDVGPSLGRIVYMARESPDATWDVWVMRGDGSDPRQLTDSPADDMSPTWSPDGKQVAFVSDRDGNREVYVMKADGSQQVNLTHDATEDWTPAWSPDGKEIAFSSYRDGNWEIYVMDPSGANVQRLTAHSGADYGPCWSPGGQEIAFHSNRDGNWEIYALNRDAGMLRRLTENEATDTAPAWSPDGTQIAFESYRDGNMEIYLMTSDGTEQWNISNDPYSNEHGPTWGWNGTQLVYFSNRDSGWDIFSMQLDGSEERNLTVSPALENAPKWHE